MENDFLIAGQTCFASLSQIGKFRFHSFECFPYGDRSKAPFNRFLQTAITANCSPPSNFYVFLGSIIRAHGRMTANRVQTEIVCCWRSSLELITIFKYICADSYTEPNQTKPNQLPCAPCRQTSPWNIYYANIAQIRKTALHWRRKSVRGNVGKIQTLQRGKLLARHKCLLTIKFTSLHLNLKHCWARLLRTSQGHACS